MVAEKYIEMGYEGVLRELVVNYMANPSEGKNISEELLKSERYKSDFQFRIIVDVTHATLLGIFGDYKNVVPLCGDVLQRANAYEMWNVISLAWNTLGTTYYMLGMYERAIECFYNTIANDKVNGLSWFSSTSYNNIGLIYMKLNDSNMAQKYFKLAFDALEEGGENQPRYFMKKILYLSDMALELTMADGMDAAKLILDEISEFDLSGLDPESLFYYHQALMFFNFYSNNIEEGEKAYRECRKSAVVENRSELIHLLCAYAELLERSEISGDVYKEALMEIKEHIDEEGAFFGVWFYERIRRHYKEIGDEENYKKATDEYIRRLEKESLENKLEKLNSVNVISALIKESSSIKRISSKNEELRMIADEVNLRNQELQEAYHRIEMINKLGSKVTSSLDLNEVVSLTYEILKENIPFDVFFLVVVDREERKFKSIFNYIEEKEQKPLLIDMDDEASVLSICYKERRTILSDEGIFEEKLRLQLERDEANFVPAFIPSAIYVPLIVKEEVIGICTVQYSLPKVYQNKHTQFLEALSPYLSISLNNALRSWELEKEIDSHLTTRRKLERANKRLERVSSLDGLTEINGRRVFDAKIIELLRAAKRLHTSISVLMLDIDNFKLYNDTYGHLEGDEVLKQVARIFRKNMDEESGLSARFGGEEFIGACLGLSLTESENLGNRIRQDIYNLGIEHGKSETGVVTVSVGVSVALSADEYNKSCMMRVADECLYQAKNTGKNKVIIKRIDNKDLERKK